MRKTPLIAAAFLAMTAASAGADELERVPPITDPVVKEECGSCHMAFQPDFLSKKEWRAIMADLANHYGEDASLDEETRAGIEAYMVAHAPSRAWKSVGRRDSLPRITERRWWVHEHEEEVPRRVWQRPDVGSKANCPACHKAADRGWYEDD